MKKTYAVPTLTLAGDAVRETKSPFSGPESLSGNVEAPGSVGFHL
jgi:hypothetical protein